MHVIVARADNHPPMLDKSQYNSWKSLMLLYIKGKEQGKDLYDSVINGPFQYGTVEVPRTKTTLLFIRERTYDDLTDKEKIHKACDIRATNIVLQGLQPDESESKLYDEFDAFTLEKGETIHSYYLRFAQLINDMNMTGMSMKPLMIILLQDLKSGRSECRRWRKEKFSRISKGIECHRAWTHKHTRKSWENLLNGGVPRKPDTATEKGYSLGHKVSKVKEVESEEWRRLLLQQM
ncbi:hypothetical protein Tco_0486423 [Tanacetum coccineum]